MPPYKKKNTNPAAVIMPAPTSKALQAWRKWRRSWIKWSKLWESPEEMGGTAGDLVAVWKYSATEIAKHPFTGVGLGRHSFSKAYPEFRATHQPLLWHAHNMFMDLTVQLGLQGLAAILWIMIALVAALWPRSPPVRGDAISLFSGAAAVMVVGFCVRNLTDDFFVKDSALFFWLLSGLALGAGYWRKAGKSDKGMPQTPK